jgi:hypothetical protein
MAPPPGSDIVVRAPLLIGNLAHLHTLLLQGRHLYFEVVTREKHFVFVVLVVRVLL